VSDLRQAAAIRPPAPAGPPPSGPSAPRLIALECLACGEIYPTGYHPVCERCAGPTDVFHDLRRAVIGPPGQPSPLRYADLLPIADRARIVHAGEGDTPLVHARALGRRYGLDALHLKYEAANPTRSTKDRMATVALAFLAERGVDEITLSSTGNSSTAFGAVAGRFPGMRMHIFCGRDFVDRLTFADAPNLDVYVVEGTFVDAGRAAAQFARDRGIAFERGFFNPGRREGLKLAYLEAFDAMPQPDVVIQAISSGMGLYGAYKGAAEYRAMGRLARIPRMVCAQQASCAPMYRGWSAGLAVLGDEHVDPDPRGPAQAILRGDARATYPLMRQIVRDTGGCFTAVTDDEIRQAVADARDLEGLAICPASAVALASAGRLAATGAIAADETVLVNLTGADRPPGVRPTVRPYRPPT
jgi:threonine synthase